MKATELRIGNLVYGYKTVWSIDSTDFCNIGVIETYQPIPLTEEWLLKFGFEKIVTNGIEFIKYSKYKTFEIEVSLFVMDYKLVNVNDFEISYIHQLQNYYFALTGEELKIKL